MTDLTRRDVLCAASGAAVAASAGCLGGGGGRNEVAALDAPEGIEVVEVGPEDSYRYTPEELTVSPGTTVRFVWLSNGHDLAVKSQPADADWQGVQTLERRGSSHEVTFDVPGVYEYVCTPHRQFGMRGSVTVTEQ
jgi:plastocyanin